MSQPRIKGTVNQVAEWQTALLSVPTGPNGIAWKWRIERVSFLSWQTALLSVPNEPKGTARKWRVERVCARRRSA